MTLYHNLSNICGEKDFVNLRRKILAMIEVKVLLKILVINLVRQMKNNEQNPIILQWVELITFFLKVGQKSSSQLIDLEI